MRGLDRIECLIVHYNRPDETVGTTAAQIARRLATLLPLIAPTLFNIIVIGEYVHVGHVISYACHVTTVHPQNLLRWRSLVLRVLLLREMMTSLSVCPSSVGR